MSRKLNGAITIPCSLDKNFFIYWLKFLTPYHSLSNRELEIAACFLKHRFILNKAITDKAVLDEVLMSKEIQKKIKEECNITNSHFQAVLSKFRKVQFIKDDKINYRFVPKNIKEGDTSVMLLLNFVLNAEDD